MGNYSQLLSPKMAQQFADRAKAGDFAATLGSEIYLWFQGNQEICLIGLDCPTGHITKLSSEAMKRRKAELKVA